MVEAESQVCVRVNSHGVRVTSQPDVQVISKQCTSRRLCWAPPLPISETVRSYIQIII